MTVTYRDRRTGLGTGTFRDTSRVLSRPVPPVSGTNVPKVPSRPKCPASSVHRRASDRGANREREYEARNSPRRPTEMPRISVRAGRVSPRWTDRRDGARPRSISLKGDVRHVRPNTTNTGEHCSFVRYVRHRLSNPG